MPSISLGNLWNPKPAPFGSFWNYENFTRCAQRGTKAKNRAEISNVRTVKRVVSDDLFSVDRCQVCPKLIQRHIEWMRLQFSESGIAAKGFGERQKSWMLGLVLFYDGSARLALQKPKQGKQLSEHGNGAAERTTPNGPAACDEFVEFREPRYSFP